MQKYFLDITKDHCPMTFVKVKLKLEQMQAGDELEILLTDGEPLENVPRSAKDEGCEILSQEKKGEFYLIKLRK